MTDRRVRRDCWKRFQIWLLRGGAVACDCQVTAGELSNARRLLWRILDSRPMP